MEATAQLNGSNHRENPLPRQRGIGSPASGPFHNTYPAAMPAMGCWRITKKMKHLLRVGAGLGQLLLMGFLGKLLPLFYL